MSPPAVDSPSGGGHPPGVRHVEPDEPLPTIEGRALSFGLLLSADDVLTPPHDGLPPALARRHLFVGVDASLAPRLAAGDVVVANEFRGVDPLASRVLAALAAAGIVALVAERFAPAIVAAAAAAGVVTVVIDTPSFLRTDDRVRLDLDAAKVVNLSSGDRAAIRNAGSPAERTALRATLARAGAR